MSRIIIKNLPKKVAEADVRKIFSEIGPITDIKLKYKKGEFRGFCFVGYEREDDGKQAQSRFQNSYVKQNKISVEPYKDLETFNSESSRNKTDFKDGALKSSKTSVPKETSPVKKKKAIEQDENQLDSNIDSNKATKSVECTKSKKPPEDGEKDNGCIENEAEETCEGTKAAVNETISDIDYLKSLRSTNDEEVKTGLNKNQKWVEMFTVVIRVRESVKRKDNKGKILTKKNVKEFFRPLKLKSLRIPRHDSSVAFIGFTSEKIMKQALMKDNSFISGVRVKVQFHEPEIINDNYETGDAPWSAAAERLRTEADPVAESGKLFVRNLWYSATEETLKEYFEKIGPISDISVPLCKTTRKSKGFAHITYVFPEHALKAMNELDGKTFKGRILHILPSLKKDPNEIQESDTFKEKKIKQQKSSANSWHNWNSLFMSSSAVIELMSEKYGRSKKEIFDMEGDQSAGVNLALGETLLVDECKRFLERAGISLDVFTDASVQRSSTVILVKNLAPKTTAQELEEIFGKYGELGRVIMPPSGVTGVVEFLDTGEAKYAFNKLAYSRFKHSPLYLEWAPVKTFTSPPKTKTTSAVAVLDNELKEEKDEGGYVEAPEPNTTLYVKNLSFDTDENAFKTHFTDIAEVYHCLISKKRNLSQGYGFIQYFKAKDAQKALRDLQDSYLDGHNIQIKISEKVLTNPNQHKRKALNLENQNSSKILVKNIPFHATTKEIKQLFGTFGQLKLARLPLKSGMQEHRGFGFVEYVSVEDAKKAFESLSSSSHLYGRRLVLEWAMDEENIEQLRKKTADQFLGSSGKGPPTKKSRIDVNNLGGEQNNEKYN